MPWRTRSTGSDHKGRKVLGVVRSNVGKYIPARFRPTGPEDRGQLAWQMVPLLANRFRVRQGWTFGGVWLTLPNTGSGSTGCELARAGTTSPRRARAGVALYIPSHTIGQLARNIEHLKAMIESSGRPGDNV